VRYLSLSKLLDALRAHPLDLRGLLFELRREDLHLFLLQRDGGLQLCNARLLFLDFLCSLSDSSEERTPEALGGENLRTSRERAPTGQPGLLGSVTTSDYNAADFSSVRRCVQKFAR
jgi:hypothetical protein